MEEVFLLIGGNLGNRKKNFERAKLLIQEYCGNIVKSSSIYETAAWGKMDQPDFLNQVIEIETNSDAKQLMKQILKVEKIMGRERNEKYGPRVIDIDILLFDHDVYDYPHLKIPHPELPNRRFALVPLNEIAADVRHPVLNKSISQLLEECPDVLDVKKI